jgi:hypothetical protein
MEVFKISNRFGVLTIAGKTTGLGKITENISNAQTKLTG